MERHGQNWQLVAQFFRVAEEGEAEDRKFQPHKTPRAAAAFWIDVEERSAAECAAEYAEMCDEWSRTSRQAVTARKLVESCRTQRLLQLKERIRKRAVVIERLEQCANAGLKDPLFTGILEACWDNPENAMLQAGLVVPGESYGEAEDDLGDDGFGPFRGRLKKKPKPLPKPHEKPVEPFSIPGSLAPTLFVQPLRNLTDDFHSAHHEPPTAADKKFLWSIFESICASKHAGLFLEPVTDAIAPGYSEVVKHPVCLADIRKKMTEGEITEVAAMYRMLSLMLANAFVYNAKNSDVWRAAAALQDVIRKECEPLLIVGQARSLMTQGNVNANNANANRNTTSNKNNAPAAATGRSSTSVNKRDWKR